MRASNVVSKHDISSEIFRVYHYSEDVLFIADPSELYIVKGSTGLTHRVVTKDGECYRPEPGYLGISWSQDTDEPFNF